jgi:hypothetical protein
MLSPALAALLAAALEIHIPPDVACPRPEGLKTALVGLLPAAEKQEGASGTARLSKGGRSLLVQVVDSGGRLLSERRLEPADWPAERCSERTAEVAVIVAAAMATLRGPGTAGPPEEPPTLRMSGDDPLAAAPASHRGGFYRTEIGLSLGASLAGSTAAPAVGAGIAYLAKPWLAVAIGGQYTGEHAQAVDSGQATWSRWAGLAGLTFRGSLVGRLWIDGGAAAVAGMRVIEGRSFPQTLRSHTFDPGLALSLRLGAVGERRGFWAGATLGWWARKQAVYLQGSAERSDLPSLELMVGIGMTFGLGVISPGHPT